MYHRDLKIIGVPPAHANALWRLVTFKGTERPRPSLCLALLRDGKPLVVTNGFRGFVLPEKFRVLDEENIEAAARYVKAKVLVAVEEAAWVDILEQVQSKLRVGDDNFVMAELFLVAFREALEAGRLIIYPDLFNFIFDLRADRLRRFADAAFPKNSSIVVYLFQGQSLEAGLTIVRGEEYIETVAGHGALGEAAEGFHPWQKGYGRILDAVKKKYAPPSMGFFAEIDEIRNILWYPEAGSFLRNFVAGNIVIDPMPAWVAAALGVDAVTRVARTSMDLIRQFDTMGITRRFDLGMLGRTLQEHLKKEEISLEAIVGFDPVTFLSKLIAWLAG